MRVSRDYSSTRRARSSDRARTAPGSGGALDGTVGRTVLPNGVRILTEAIPAMRSVSVGMWVPIGSRDESLELGGVSHFLEHLLFKGTRRRTALDISATIEAVGGETNAFTTKEYTCYYARVLDADLPLAIDVMGDLLTDSVLAAADVETERGVILEEIAMHDDEPDDEVHDLFAEAVYGDDPLGRLVSGTPTTIGAMTRASILDFYHEHYRGPALVVAAAGNLDHDTVVRLVEDVISRSDRFRDSAAPQPRRTDPAPALAPAPRTIVRDKDTEQAHVLLGCPALARDDDRRFSLGVLNNVVGGGMSARLFQEIREKRGLAYSIYSYTAQYAGSGLFGVYAGCAPGKVDQVLALAREQLAEVAAHGLTDEEVRRGKGMLKGALVLGLEDTGSRMTRLAKSEMLYDELLSVNDLLDRVDAVTAEEVATIAADLFVRPMSLAAIGASLPDLDR